MYISEEEAEYLREKGRFLCDGCRHQPDNWPEIAKKLHTYASGPWCRTGKAIRANGAGSRRNCSDYAPFEKRSRGEKPEQLRLF